MNLLKNFFNIKTKKRHSNVRSLYIGLPPIGQTQQSKSKSRSRSRSKSRSRSRSNTSTKKRVIFKRRRVSPNKTRNNRRELRA